MTTDSAPNSAALSITAFIPGTATEHPSSPNLLAAENFVAKNSSNNSAHANLSKMCSFLSFEYCSCTEFLASFKIETTYVTDQFESFTDPVALVSVWYVHVLVPNVPTIHFPKA